MEQLNFTKTEQRIRELEIVLSAIRGELETLNEVLSDVNITPTEAAYAKTSITMYAKMITETRQSIYNLKNNRR
jgi:hypothetical protein